MDSMGGRDCGGSGGRSGSEDSRGVSGGVDALLGVSEFRNAF